MLDRRDTPREMDERLKRLVREMRTAEAEVATGLLEMKRRKLHHCLGYSRIQDYALMELGIGCGKAKELVQLAETLERLPKIREAFESGELEWTKARTIARVATPETEAEWVEVARANTNRKLEEMVAEAKGEEPLVHVTLVMTRQHAADLDEAVRVIREERGEAVDLGEAVAEACRRSMGPPVDRPGFQVVIHQCKSCGRASRAASDGDIEVSNEELDAAKVDSEILDLTEGGKGKFRKTITPAERRAVIARDHKRCSICGTQAWRHIHHLARKDGDVGVLTLLCSGCHQHLVHAGHVTLHGRAPDLEMRLRDGRPLRARDGDT